MGSIFKSILRIAPIALPILAPGLGTALGTALGATGATAGTIGSGLIGAAAGGLSGGGLKGAALGGLTGGLAGGGAGQLAGAAGLTGTGAKVAANALTGAATGGLSGGGLKSVLLGGALGAGTGLLSGGVSGAVDALGGDSYGAIEGGGLGGKLISGGDSLINSGKAALGFGNVANTSNVAGSGATGGGTSAFSKASSLLSGFNSLNAQDSAKDDLLESQDKSLAALNPYLQNGAAANARLAELMGTGGDPNSADYGALGKDFVPGDLTQDPGYKFDLAQGNEAINRSLGAQGKVFSGEALKEAAKFGTGLADKTYNDAYNRDRQNKMDIYNRYFGASNTGQNAANSAAGIYDNQGNIKANNAVANSNVFSSVASNLMNGGRTIVGYDSAGNPIYADDPLSAANKTKSAVG